jgi:hypothetical protein
MSGAGNIMKLRECAVSLVNDGPHNANGDEFWRKGIV